MGLVSDIKTIVERDWPGLLMAAIVGGTLAIVIALMLSYRSEAIELHIKVDDVRHKIEHNSDDLTEIKRQLAERK